jgi:hypothetical protein
VGGAQMGAEAGSKFFPHGGVDGNFQRERAHASFRVDADGGGGAARSAG